MRPTLVYDGDCAMCTRLSAFVARRIRRTSRDFGIVAFQFAELSELGLTEAECTAALQWVDADGVAHAGPNAIARLLRSGRVPWRPLGWALSAPGASRVAWPVYQWVADNRHRLPGGTPACSMPPAQRPH